MKLMPTIRAGLLAAAVALPAWVRAAATEHVEIDFDEFPASEITCCYYNTGVHGALTYPTVTVDGGASGAVMDGKTGWNNFQTSGSDLYGTESGVITLSFAGATSGISFDIVNGAYNATAGAVQMFGASGGLIYSGNLELGGWGSNVQEQHLAFTAADVYKLELFGGTDFAIDTLGFTIAVPEPSSFALMAAALAAFVLRARRRRDA